MSVAAGPGSSAHREYLYWMLADARAEQLRLGRLHRWAAEQRCADRIDELLDRLLVELRYQAGTQR